mmetsp:Transcript_17521/g.44123  ORF Transcript_17521/g.44123 Transcript_17521/m.44123 type:complete len:862 (-) Transcript_17521:77-2662(-)
MVTALDTFGDASGQKLNVSKSQLLPVGHIPGPPPSGEVCGMKIVTAAKTLGVTFSNDPAGSTADWPDLLQQVHKCYGKVARMSLSMFGRAFAAAGYGISKMLYHAEFSPPPLPILQQLQSSTVKLVDKGLAPTASPLRRGHRLPGVRAQLLPGRPESGGVGMLPWQPHITARHAVWARRLLEGLAKLPIAAATAAADMLAPPPRTPPWVLAAAATLSAQQPRTHPALTFLSVCCSGQDAVERLPCPALRRLASGLCAVGPVRCSDLTVLPVGAWCAHLPLWDNPLLQLQLPLQQRPPSYQHAVQQLAVQRAQNPQVRPPVDPAVAAQWEQQGFGVLSLLPGVTTVGELRALMRRLQAPSPPQLTLPAHLQRHQQLVRQGLCPWSATNIAAFMQALRPGAGSILSFPSSLHQLVGAPLDLYAAVVALWQAVPQPWRTAACHDVPDDGTAMTLLLRSVSWGSSLAQQPPQPPPPPPPVLWPTGPLHEAAAWVPPGPAPLMRLFDARPTGQAVFSVRHATIQQTLAAGAPTLIAQEQLQCVQAALALGMPAAADEVRLYLRVQQRPARHVHVGLMPAPPQPPLQHVQQAAEHMRARMPHVWRLPWDNKWKEPWWRLLLGGLPAAGGHGICLRGPCLCGWAVPASFTDQQGAAAQRDHVMWHCAPARAVRALIQHHLPPMVQLQPEHLWLLHPPSHHIHPGVWSVVALAALSAISGARSYMWAMHCHRKEAPAPQLHQLLLSDMPGWRCPPHRGALLLAALQPDGQDDDEPDAVVPLPPHITIPQMAARRAVAETLAAVRDFVAGGVVPSSWVPAQAQRAHAPAPQLRFVGADHLFIGVNSGMNEQGQVHHDLQFRMHLPEHLNI